MHKIENVMKITGESTKRDLISEELENYLSNPYSADLKSDKQRESNKNI